MTFTIAIIRKAAQKAARYGAVNIAQKVPGSVAAQVLTEIDAALAYLGLQHYVTLVEFQNAAVRCGLAADWGTQIYMIMGYIL